MVIRQRKQHIVRLIHNYLGRRTRFINDDIPMDAEPTQSSLKRLTDLLDKYVKSKDTEVGIHAGEIGLEVVYEPVTTRIECVEVDRNLAYYRIYGYPGLRLEHDAGADSGINSWSFVKVVNGRAASGIVFLFASSDEALEALEMGECIFGSEEEAAQPQH